MTAAVFFGCAFIAFGPALALYIVTIATEPLRIIFLIVGAFFWLVSLLLSSLVWFVARTITDGEDESIQKYLLIFGVLISVLIQEMFRFAYYRLLKKANEGLKIINPDETAPSMRLLAYAFMTLVIILLHMFWGIVFFDGCEKKNWYALLVVLLTHLLVSALTFISPHYAISLVSAYVIMVLMGTWAFFVAGGSCRSLKMCLLCQDKDFLLFNPRSR
ncbi:gamma-secretase subunit APH-1B isoform X2 [Pteronotus mesoamericanus]|uniref:gamma-secretase subunit APH-1B isoform X2 n=1 Tax=Pteronotus mesoamericanus TaxID=1884717 RepID=UPI0023EDE595|nr:gamma-secretase subunit APH-1B isoform X2 [Pteronotus parnellii mesoamericanus]